MLDIHQLNIFLTAAETLSFTQAAQRLHMTQPSVSQHIQALEKHFQAELFLRQGRNLELSDAGLALVPLAREAVSLSVRIDELMASVHGDVIGHLMVGCSTTPGKYVLPQLLARFHNIYPMVRVTCQVSSQRDAMRLLMEGGVHFALTSLLEEHQPDFEMHKFFCDRVLLMAPFDHPWAKKKIIQPEELLTTKFILREDTSGTYAAVRDALAKVGIAIQELDVLLTLGNSEAIAMSVQEGLGVGFISEMVINRIGQLGTTKVEIEGIDIQRDIFISRNLRRPATVAQDAFWSFIHSKENPIFCKEDRWIPNTISA